MKKRMSLFLAFCLLMTSIGFLPIQASGEAEDVEDAVMIESQDTVAPGESVLDQVITEAPADEILHEIEDDAETANAIGSEDSVSAELPAFALTGRILKESVEKRARAEAEGIQVKYTASVSFYAADHAGLTIDHFGLQWTQNGQAHDVVISSGGRVCAFTADCITVDGFFLFPESELRNVPASVDCVFYACFKTTDGAEAKCVLGKTKVEAPNKAEAVSEGTPVWEGMEADAANDAPLVPAEEFNEQPEAAIDAEELVLLEGGEAVDGASEEVPAEEAIEEDNGETFVTPACRVYIQVEQSQNWVCLTATVEGPTDVVYSYQWQYFDGNVWVDVPCATDTVYGFVPDAMNTAYPWRVAVKIVNP